MKDIDEKFLELKEKTQLMLDLAYSSLLYDNKIIAREVYHLEEDADREHDELQRMAIEDATEDKDIEKALVYVKLATALEVIADSAREISDIALRDMDMHPIFQQSLRDSDSIITSAVVSEKSPVASKRLADAELPTETGMWIVAVKRGKKWIYGPDGDFVLQKGDMVIARGPTDSEDEFISLIGRKVEWESVE